MHPEQKGFASNKHPSDADRYRDWNKKGLKKKFPFTNETLNLKAIIHTTQFGTLRHLAVTVLSVFRYALQP